VVPLLLLSLAIGIHWTTARIEAETAIVGPLVETVPYREVAPWLSAARRTGDAEAMPIGFSIDSGETLGSALEELGVEARDIHDIGRAMSSVVSPRELRPGDGYAAFFTADSRIGGIEMTVEGRGRMQLTRASDGWQPSWRPFERRVGRNRLEGQVESALEAAIVRAGGEAGVAYRMADVLQWDLDFNRDLRKGDRFEVLYERNFVDGSFDTVGDILALRYRNGGDWLEAYRFGDDGGYFDFAGRPLRKMFLRSPVPYSRVTSRFSNRRFHPILKRYRPHYGVDFGAPTGTPVRVTANGVVRSAGWTNGGGKTVKVGHANGYVTAYLHLSKYARGIASGVRVSQGQIIGYVGSTGLSTAPHLDYRVQHNGRWINPMSLKSEPTDPVPVEDLERFERWRDAYRRALRSGEPWVPPASGGKPTTGRIASTEPPDEAEQAEIVAR
jgi:murein DD-endopeptidase MepM/ murein hydrolase activator NlpD